MNGHRKEGTNAEKTQSLSSLGLEMKRALLGREGICFNDVGRVKCPRLHCAR